MFDRVRHPPMRYRGPAAATLLVFLAGTVGHDAHERANAVTWLRDVEPIVQRRCASCHRAGGVANLPLADFDAAARLAPRIRDAVLAQRMPPWSAAPGFGDFSNDASLTPYETELLVAWTYAGMQKGEPEAPSADAHHAAPVPAAPDLILTTGVDTPVRSHRQQYVLQTRARQDRWIHGWEFLPGNEALIRQARITIDSRETLGVWVPPRGAVFLPDGVAQRLRAGATLTLDIEYERPAEPSTDRSALGLYLGAPPSSELARMRLTRGRSALGEDVRLLAIRPELERSGESMRVIAQRPDGTSEALVWVRDYDARYPTTYRFRDPVRLPAGSIVTVFSFDGTAAAHIDFVRARATAATVRSRARRN